MSGIVIFLAWSFVVTSVVVVAIVVASKHI